MPRKCTVEGCTKFAKWKEACSSVLKSLSVYSCNEHVECLRGVQMIRIVNSPCKTCIIENPLCVKEASFGPIIDGKRTRLYCKLHKPIDNRLIKKKIVKTRRCVFPKCSTTPSFTDGTNKSRIYCKEHRPKRKEEINSSCDNNINTNDEK